MNPFIFHIAAIPEIFLYFNLIQTADLIFPYIDGVHEFENSWPHKLKFIYSEKATKFCEIFTLLLSYVVQVKNKVKISQSFVAFSEYKNFT